MKLELSQENVGYLVTGGGGKQKKIKSKSVRLGTLSPAKIWAQMESKQMVKGILRFPRDFHPQQCLVFSVSIDN